MNAKLESFKEALSGTYLEKAFENASQQSFEESKKIYQVVFREEANLLFEWLKNPTLHPYFQSEWKESYGVMSIIFYTYDDEGDIIGCEDYLSISIHPIVKVMEMEIAPNGGISQKISLPMGVSEEEARVLIRHFIKEQFQSNIQKQQ